MARSATKPRLRCSIASAPPARRCRKRPENLLSGEGALGSGSIQPRTLLMTGGKTGLRSSALPFRPFMMTLLANARGTIA